MKAEKNRRRIFIAILVIFGLNLYLIIQYFSESDKKLRFYACDVGQGDAFYLRTTNQQDILIDGGPDRSVLNCLGKAMPFWDKKIEVMMLTHPNSDHYEGLKFVLDRYRVEKIILTGYKDEAKGFADFLNKIESEGAEKVIVGKGDKLNFGESAFEVLGPENGKDYKDLNNTSIVGVYSSGETEILFTGDADLKETLGLKDIDILKVPHHGSRNNITKEVLDVVKPEIAIIPAGKNNSYGHPHNEVIQMLESINAKIVRTYDLGNKDILVSLQGQSLQK